ncbi:DUF2889 domain-containing protein [Pseudomonas sp. LA21]|uniref:DUF2889 domain-containing protein n=1 Tax=unclassified Pseudomonas TaxID=196821 RepID=UPI001FB7BD7A|nr:DUF2889 domain-containing protein [Pseudomonas sp. LA21]MCJ1887047.1 DUF2889 domain-containing protein [Pseudomonas sp. LA21]
MNDAPNQLDEGSVQADGRQLLHVRQIVCKGYRRQDQLFEFEGSLHDRKTYDSSLPFREIAAGEAVHSMQMTMVLDEALVIREIRGTTGSAPTPYCYEIDGAYAALQGLSIAQGFRANALERIGSEKGCTHLTDLLWSLATTAIQTTATLKYDAARKEQENNPATKPHWIVGTCHAYRADGDVVRIMGLHPTANEQGPTANRS